MKKILFSVLMCSALSACLFQSDYTPENAENRALKRAVEGCQVGDNHAAYRECMIQTQLKNSPKTYVTAELPNGEALAIIRNGNQPATQTITETTVVETTTTGAITTAEQTTETIEVVESLPTPTDEIYYLVDGVQMTPEQYVQYQEEQAKPCDCANKKQAEVYIVVNGTQMTPTQYELYLTTGKVENTQQNVGEKTWWETYQENKPAPAPVQCSCDDPNVSCPFCYEK